MFIFWGTLILSLGCNCYLQIKYYFMHPIETTKCELGVDTMHGAKDKNV